MSNMVERSSIALKVKNLSKIRSFSSRYRKKKQFCNVLKYQKLHKFQNYQRKLKKLKTLQELVYVSKNTDGKEKGEDRTSTTVDEIDNEESFEEEEYSSDEDFISDSEEDIDIAGMEEEYPNSGEEWNNMDEEYSSDEELYMEEEEESSSENEEENPEHTNIPTNENLLVEYDFTDNEISDNEEDTKTLDPIHENENNGNLLVENLNEFSNIEEIDVSDELNVSEIDGDDIEALMSMQFRDTRLQSHIREHNLNLIPREATRNDGNCWYDAIADQVVLHEVIDKPTNHVDLRQAVCEAIPKLPQAKEWILNIFGDEDTFTDFLEDHKIIGTWTDSLGIMCQATALFLERNIHLVGTANIGQGVAFTKLESVEEANEFPPFTVGYYQDRHYQSLQERPQEYHEDPQRELDMSMNSDRVRKMIDEERLLSESVFDSDCYFDEIYHSDDELDSFDNNFINSDDSLTDMSMNSDRVRKMIDEERLLSESVFDSDSDLDEIYHSDDELDSFVNNFINSDDSLTDMLKNVDRVREANKDDPRHIEPSVKIAVGKSRNLLNRFI